MRLLIHGINYAPELIGIGRYTGETGAWLAARGHQVSVLTANPYYPEWRVDPAYRGRGWRREWRERVEVLRAPLYIPTQITGKKRLLHELSFRASCLYWGPRLFRRRWDAVLAISVQSGLFSYGLARKQRIPFIIHVQDLQVDAARELGIIPQSGLLTCLERLEGFLLQRATAVTTISTGMAARLRSKGVPDSRLHLIPNWADLKGIQPQSRNNRVRRQLGFASEILVLYAGNLGEQQGLEVILEAARLTREKPAIQYILAGEGAAKTRLMALAREQGLDNLRFLPVQSSARFPLLLAAADIHLIIQRQKAADLVMPSKLTNILAAGRPFIATARPRTELGQITADSQAGWLISPEDAPALAQAIRQLASDHMTRSQMGIKARQYAETHLDREAILTRLEDLLYGLGNANQGSDRRTTDRSGAGPPLS